MKYVFSIVLLITGSGLIGQNINTKAYWASVGLSHQINKKIESSVETSYRTNGFLSSHNFFGQVGLNYKLTKNARLKIKYRYGWKLDDGLRSKNRIDLDYTNKYKIDQIWVQYRGRLQGEKKNRRNDEDAILYDLIIRNKISFDKKINKNYTGSVAYEHFSQLSTLQLISGYRLSMGVDIDLGKRKEFNISYIYDKQFVFPQKLNEHIISISYSFSL